MACTDLMKMSGFSFATKITMNVSWPPTIAVKGCTAGATPPCTYELLIKTDYTVNGNELTSSSKTCASKSPPTTYTATGNVVAGVAAGQLGEVLLEIPTTTWDKPGMPITPGKAHLGGWNVGATITVDESTTLVGFDPAKNVPYKDPTVAWPKSVTGLDATTFNDPDGDGNPGITGNFRNDMPYYYPHTALDAMSPQVDQLYVVSRNTMTLFGTSVSCSEYQGTAVVSHLDNHFAGCHEKNGMACNTMNPDDGSEFIDANNTVYNVDCATFDSKQLTKGMSSTCDDVRALFP